MTRFARITLVLPLLLAACGTGDETKTTTKLDAVEVQPGSVSDAMVMLDDADADGTSLDGSGGALTAEGAAATKAEADRAAEEAPADEAADEPGDESAEPAE